MLLTAVQYFGDQIGLIPFVLPRVVQSGISFEFSLLSY